MSIAKHTLDTIIIDRISITIPLTMFVSSIRKIILPVLLLGSLAVKAKDANCNPLNIRDTIHLVSPPFRTSVEIVDGGTAFLLCNLKPGRTYRLFLNPAPGTTARNERLNLSSGNILSLHNEGRELVFRATDACQDVEVLRPVYSDASEYFQLSIGCDDCPEFNFSNRSASGILTDDQRYTPQQLIQDIFIGGDCFDVDAGSIDFQGEPSCRGYFSNCNSSINIEEGVILATGLIENSQGPNEVYNRGNTFFNPAWTDPDLRAVLNSTNPIYDVSSLEFDFTPTSDTISFEFVFASEEYCEYAGSNYNDVFGFFISGPGINGPFSNNAENIAIVPGTSDYVTINNVNHYLNTNYYVNNIPSQQHDDMPSYLECDRHTRNDGLAINDIEYDGFTVLLTALARVQPCETYHIKLIVADVNDAYYDSAVFLKANSFTSGGSALLSTEVPDFGGDTAFEGCKNGAFVFERVNDDLSEDEVVNFHISPSSTATQGSDYEALPSSIIIPAGDSIAILPVNVFDDVLQEGSESVILELDAPCSCTLPTTVLYIDDVDSLKIDLQDQSLCGPSSLTLEPTVSGGIPNYTYSWNTGANSPDLLVNASQDEIFSLEVTDACDNSVQEIVEVEILEIPTAFISGFEAVCPGNPSADLSVTFSGDGPWSFAYTLDNGPEIQVNGITDNPYFLNVSDVGTYLLSSVNNQGCIGTVSGAGTLVPVNLNVNIQASQVTCPNADDGAIDLEVSGGTAPYQFQWNNGAPNIEDPNGLAEGNYEVTVTDRNGCTTIASIEVAMRSDIPQVDAGLEQTLNCTITDLNLLGTGSSGPTYSYNWTTLDGNIVSGENTINPNIDQPGTYQFRVTNTLTGCVQEDDVFVRIDTISPQAIPLTQGPLVLDCNFPNTILDASSSAPFGNLSFLWSTTNGLILPGNETLSQFEITKSGTYTLQVKDNLNGCLHQSSITIGVDMDLPLVDIVPPTFLTCSDSIIQLDGQASSKGSRFLYLWSSSNGNITSGATTLSPLVNQAGIYSLMIRDTVNGCRESQQIEVPIDTLPPQVDAGEVNEMLDCDTPELSLNGSASADGNPFDLFWTTTNGNISSTPNSLTPMVNQAGWYTLTVTSLKNGCSATDNVTVEENTNVPTDVNILAEPPLCYGGQGSLTVTSVVGGEGPYVFALDGGPFFNATDAFDSLYPGTYNLLIQDINGCEYGEDFTVPGTAPFIVDLQTELEIKLGHEAELRANTNTPLFRIDTILWTPIDSLSCTNCLNPLARPVENTLYQITVIDINGCIASDEVLVTVDKTRHVYIPNAFTPNNDGYNDEFLVYADDLSVSNIRRFQIFNRWGEQVFNRQDFLPNQTGEGWDGRMNGEAFNPGVFVYLVEIEFIDGITKVYKGDVTLLD